jgi:hypothetical protein
MSSHLSLASSDACSPSVNLYFSRPSLDSCSLDLEFLESFNDTAKNLSVLLNLAKKWENFSPLARTANPITKEEYEERFLSFFQKRSEPSLEIPEVNTYLDCPSNTYESAGYFLDQVTAAHIQNHSAQELAKLRTQILTLCGPSENAAEIEKNLNLLEKDQSLRSFVIYLKGILHFYTDDFETAEQDFEMLSKRGTHGISKLALYLKGRSLLKQAQKGWDGYSPLSDSNFPTLSRAKQAFDDYIQADPQGRFVSSARGLIRRVAYLKGETNLYETLLWKEFDRSIKNKQQLEPIGMEIDTHVKYTGNVIPFDRPLFAALGALKENREDPEKNTLPKNSIELLEKNKNQYRPYFGLYEFTRVNLLFGLGFYEQAAQLKSPIVSNKSDVLLISHQIVNAKAYEKLKKFSESSKIWQGILKALPKDNSDTLLRFRSAWIRSLINDHNEEEIGKTTSEIQDITLITPAIRYFFPDLTLEKIIARDQYTKETQTIAEETLLLRYLFSKNYTEFLKQLNSSQKENRNKFNPVVTAVNQLIKDPNDAKGLMNVGYFLQTLEITPFDFLPSNDRFFSEMNAKYTRKEIESWDSPFRYYLKSINQFKPTDKSEVEAKSLSFMILCFNPSNIHCIWNEKDKESTTITQRKKWFLTLKSKYPDSTWSKKLKYYY